MGWGGGRLTGLRTLSSAGLVALQFSQSASVLYKKKEGVGFSGGGGVGGKRVRGEAWVLSSEVLLLAWTPALRARSWVLTAASTAGCAYAGLACPTEL